MSSKSYALCCLMMIVDYTIILTKIGKHSKEVYVMSGNIFIRKQLNVNTFRKRHLKIGKEDEKDN